MTVLKLSSMCISHSNIFFSFSFFFCEYTSSKKCFQRILLNINSTRFLWYYSINIREDLWLTLKYIYIVRLLLDFHILRSILVVNHRHASIDGIMKNITINCKVNWDPLSMHQLISLYKSTAQATSSSSNNWKWKLCTFLCFYYSLMHIIFHWVFDPLYTWDLYGLIIILIIIFMYM